MYASLWPPPGALRRSLADKAPAIKSPTMRGLKQVDEEAPKEGKAEPWQDQGWPEEEELPPREIFPEDDEDDSLREEGLRDELEHGGDDDTNGGGAVDDFDLPQEAEGETGAAAADEVTGSRYQATVRSLSDVLVAHSHRPGEWRGVHTGGGPRRPDRYTRTRLSDLPSRSTSAHSIYLIYKTWRARSSGASAAAYVSHACHEGKLSGRMQGRASCSTTVACRGQASRLGTWVRAELATATEPRAAP